MKSEAPRAAPQRAGAAGRKVQLLTLPGHYATERPAVEGVSDRLAADWPGVVAWASNVERDPLWLM